MLSISPIRAFETNYIWLIEDGRRAVVVDPGQADPVVDRLRADGLTLTAIFLTHHHDDHVGGVAALTRAYPVPVFASSRSRVSAVTDRLDDGDYLHWPAPDLRLNVIAVPGHTLDHLAFVETKTNSLFCGDALFGCGCGRLFEGDAAMMLSSLTRLSALPPETSVYAAHEYTRDNIAFARLVEPDSEALIERQRRVEALTRAGSPTLPSSIAEELATNPFLRVRESAVIEAASRRASVPLADPVDVFATLRTWKDMR